MKRAQLVVLALAACGGAPQTRPQPAPMAEPSPPPHVAPPSDPDLNVPVFFHGPVTTPMPGGLSAQLWRGNDGSGLCEIEFAFLGGAYSGKPGTADYAAEALLALGDSTSGRLPLRQRIQALGGGVQVDVGPGSVWLGLRVPEPNLFAALSALRAAVDAAEPTRAPLERVRDELVKQRLADLQADPIGFAARRLLLGDRGPAEYIAALQDRDPTDVVLFLQRQCRPENALLAVRSSGELADTGRAVAGNFASWKLQPLSAPPPPPPERPLRPGLYWAPSTAPVCRTALLLPLLPQRHGHALLQQVLLACLTLEGTGGRLERMLDAAGLPDLTLRVRQIDQAETRALVLEARLLPDQVELFWRTAGKALRSLQQTPPSASELALAAARARLTAYRDDAGNGAALRSRAARTLRGESEDQLQKQLSAPIANDATLQAAIESMLQLPMSMIAIGAQPAGIAADVLPLAFPPDEGASAGADAGRAEAATRELDAALQAAGGRQRLLLVDGFRCTAELRGEGAAPVREEVTFRRSGQLQRKLEVLHSTVETVVDGARQVENDAAASRPLRPREAEFLLKAQARHPLMLLAAAARGELHCRLVAVRKLQGRETAVLEVDGLSERLRLHFDAESHLLHMVESWGTDPDGTPRYLQESWSDFRTAAGLRVPFRRLSDVDDGQSRVESRCTSFTPLGSG